MVGVRMAGFKYYAGTHEIARFATKSNDEMGCAMEAAKTKLFRF